MNAPLFRPASAFLALLFSVSSALGQLTSEKIDERIAAFIEEAPADYSEQRKLRNGEVREFLLTLNADQLRALLDRHEPDERFNVILGATASRLGEFESDAAAKFVADHDRSVVREKLPDTLRSWVTQEPAAALDWTIKNEKLGETLSSVIGAIERQHPEQLEKLLEHPGLKNTAERDEGLFYLGLDKIREGDPQAGLRWLRQLAREDRVVLAPKLIPELAVLLPAETAAFLLTLPTLVQSGQNWKVVGQWAMSDPAAAMAWSKNHPDEKMRRNAMGLTLAIWSDIDPVEAWTHLVNLPEEEGGELLAMRLATYRPYLEHAGRAGPISNYHIPMHTFWQLNPKKNGDRPQIADRVGFSYRGMARAIQGEGLLGIMLARLPAEKLPAVVNIVAASPHAELAATMQRTLDLKRAHSDPSSVKDLIATFGDEKNAAGAIESFSARHPAAAIEAAGQLHEKRDATIEVVVQRWALAEPEEALRHVEGLEAGPVRELALAAHQKALAGFEIRNNLADARAAFEALPLESEERQAAFLRYVRLLLERVPAEQTLKEIDAYLDTQKFDPRRNLLTHDIGDRLLEQNPEALARWAATQPESYMRYRALREFWEHWEDYGKGEGTRRLGALGLQEREILSSRY